jgi:dihydrofolate reductase
MTHEEQDSDTVTEVLPEKRQRPLRGLYLDHGLAKQWVQRHQALVITTFLADANGVIAKAGQDKHFEVPRETRNASDWMLSQELMAQADVLICGGAYLKRVSAPGGHAQDILRQFESGGEFEDLGAWRLRTGYPKRSPDLAVISRHLDFDVPAQARIEERRITIFTTDGMAESGEAARFAAEGMAVIGGGEIGVHAGRMIDYLQDEMGARVIVMASGARVLELLLQAGRLDLLYLTRVERAIPFDDPSTVITLLPSGKRVQDLKEFHLTHQYYQDHAIAGDGLPISQFFLRYDRKEKEG